MEIETKTQIVLSADDLLDMLRDEVKIASNEGLGHFEPSDLGEPVDGTMTVTYRDVKFVVTARRLDEAPGGSDRDAAASADVCA